MNKHMKKTKQKITPSAQKKTVARKNRKQAAATPPTPPPAPKPKVLRGEVRRDFLTEIANSRKVAAAGLNSDYQAGLIAVEFDVMVPPQINTKADLIEGWIGKLKSARVEKKVMTVQEATARDALVAVLGPIQTAAKRTFTGDNAKYLADYGINASLGRASLEVVLTAARNILARLVIAPGAMVPLDVLPGIKADGKIAELSTAITLYGGKNTAQGESESEAEGTLEEIKAEIKKLIALRRQVQLAADQAWPWRTPGVATIRKAFLLPIDRPLPD